jgi:DNA-directed RNA polymerase subunit E'/Rpb7
MTSSSDLFVPIKFTTSIQLKPSELGSNIQDIIYKKLQNNLEGMCSKHGYIKKNSIKIIKRSIGHLKIPHFNGNIAYDLQCVADICNPPKGAIIHCKVKAKNSLGVRAEAFYDDVPILQVIIPKISAGIQSEINIDVLKIGDDVIVEVCGKKFLLFDKSIDIIGKALKDKSNDQTIPISEIEHIEDFDENADDNEIDNVIDISLDLEKIGGNPAVTVEDDDGDDEFMDDGLDEEEGGITDDEEEEEEVESEVDDLDSIGDEVDSLPGGADSDGGGYDDFE